MEGCNIKYMPKLDPKVDLVGATPETLARALFRVSNRYDRLAFENPLLAMRSL